MENPIDQETYQKAMDCCRTVAGLKGVDKALEENGIDLIAMSMDSPSPRIAAAAGESRLIEPVFIRTSNKKNPQDIRSRLCHWGFWTTMDALSGSLSSQRPDVKI